MKQILLFLCLGFLACQYSEKQDANLAQEQEKFSEENGHYVDYYPNGLKKIEGNLVNGKRHGKWIYYYENGIKWSEGKFLHGVRQGMAFVYYENGKIKLKGQYKNGLKIGIWEVWEDDGTYVSNIDLNEMLSAQDSIRLELK